MTLFPVIASLRSNPEIADNKRFTNCVIVIGTWSASGVCAVEKSVPPNDNYYNYRFLHYASSAQKLIGWKAESETVVFISSRSRIAGHGL